MESNNDLSSNLIHVIDDNQYNHLKRKLFELMENENFTNVHIITSKDSKYIKKVHGMILHCFCHLPNLLVSRIDSNSQNILVLNHEKHAIEHIINLLYFGRCIVPIKMLTEVMDLANYLMISQIFVYDERGSDYFINLMQHKKKLLNYLCFVKKNCMNYDINFISKDFKYIPVHRSILAAHSKKFIHYYKNRITSENPVLLYFPSSAKGLTKILEFCYFGQVVFANEELKELAEVVNLIGIDRFIYKCEFIQKKFSLNEKSNFIVIKPPENSKPEILEKIKESSLKYYVYLWIDNRCFLFPVLCLQLLKFQNYCNDSNNIIKHDVIVFFKNFYINMIKKFICSLYTWEYSTEIKPLIDLFCLKWPNSEIESFELEPNSKKVNNEVAYSSLYTNNVEDLRTISEKVFEEICSKDEMIIQLFTCQTCGKELLTRRSLALHYSEHHNNGYLCEHCGKFICKIFMTEHLKHHSALKINECISPANQFSASYGLERQVQKSSCSYEKCKRCNKNIRIEKMEKHIANHDVKFLCSICNSKFKSKYWFSKHIKKHEIRSKIKCLYCPQTFFFKYRYRDHINEEHSVTIRCRICTTTFKKESQLKQHIHQKHLKQQITCKVCGKTFLRFSYLKVHERSHTGEKPFNCKVCNKPFGRFDSMFFHMRQVHEKRLYLCPLCNKTYKSKNYFSEHGWTVHGQLFNPELHMMSKTQSNKSLTVLDPDMISQQLLNDSSDTALFPTQTAAVFNTDSQIISHGCPICSITFENFNELISHLDTHL